MGWIECMSHKSSSILLRIGHWTCRCVQECVVEDACQSISRHRDGGLLVSKRKLHAFESCSSRRDFQLEDNCFLADYVFHHWEKLSVSYWRRYQCEVRHFNDSFLMIYLIGIVRSEAWTMSTLVYSSRGAFSAHEPCINRDKSNQMYANIPGMPYSLSQHITLTQRWGRVNYRSSWGTGLGNKKLFNWLAMLKSSSDLIRC
jgi:hypothetical protein